jgi:hypothetical protein
VFPIFTHPTLILMPLSIHAPRCQHHAQNKTTNKKKFKKQYKKSQRRNKARTNDVERKKSGLTRKWKRNNSDVSGTEESTCSPHNDDSGITK